MKISKNRYLQGFGIVVLLLALVRVIFPGVAKPKVAAAGAADSTLVAAKDSAASDASSAEISDASADAEGNVAENLKKDELSVMPDTEQGGKPSIFFDKDGKEVKHRIFSVPHFGNTFPDQQDVQILAATKHGVKPVQNRLEAENSKGKLEKRSVTLGEYNTETDTYPVTDGLTAEDYIAYPDDSLKAGMTCITYDDATFDPSAGGSTGDMDGMVDTDGMEDMDGTGSMDGMDGGDMPAENDTVTDDGGSVTNSTVTVLPGGMAEATAPVITPPMEG